METISFERRGAIGLLTLRRPERLNAINRPMLRELKQFFADRHHDYECRVILITGEGRGFCSGLDLKQESEPGGWQAGVGPVQESYTFQSDIANLMVQMRDCPQPLVACVNGPAAGGGLSIAIACDTRIATPTARFACSYVNLGISGCDVGSSYFLPKIVGAAYSADMIYSGRLVDAGEALRMGLVIDIVSPEKLIGAATEIAGRWVERSSPMGLRLSKEVLNETVTGISLENALKLENRNQILAGQTEDARESLGAWHERRIPRWRDA